MQWYGSLLPRIHAFLPAPSSQVELYGQQPSQEAMARWTVYRQTDQQINQARRAWSQASDPKVLEGDGNYVGR